MTRTCRRRVVLNQLEIMAEMLKEENMVESKVCFVTQQTSFQETKEVLEDRSEMSKRDDIPWERVFGLVGIPVSHTVQNYTDPMNIGINEHLKEVVSSSECSLNQKSLWSLSGTKDTMVNLDNLCKKIWGFKSKVTAVVPIKAWNTQQYGKSQWTSKYLLLRLSSGRSPTGQIQTRGKPR